MPDDIALTDKTVSDSNVASSPLRSRLMLRFALLAVVPMIAIVGALHYWLENTRYVSTENAYVKTNIAKLAAEVSGRAIVVNAQPHLRVKQGDILVQIDPRPFEIAVSHAKAELDAARQEIKTLIATLREAQSEFQEARDRASYFRKRFERQIELAKQGITAASRRDELENDSKAADDRVTMAKQKIDRVLASLGGDANRPIDEQPMVRAKVAALSQATLDLENSTLRAPIDGTVVTVPLVPGEQITASEPLFAIVTDTAPWIDANFKETELTHVKVGQKAEIVLDIYPDVVWNAEVQSISPATGAEFAILPPQNASGNWVKVVQRLPVRLKLEAPANAPALRAGMTAEVKIDTNRERSILSIFDELMPIK